MIKHSSVDICCSRQIGTSGQLHRFENTNRTIIPVSLPSTDIQALDVSNLSSAEIGLLEQYVQKYAKYQDNIMSTIFSFEDWILHTCGNNTVHPIKWCTFSAAEISER